MTCKHFSIYDDPWDIQNLTLCHVEDLIETPAIDKTVWKCPFTSENGEFQEPWARKFCKYYGESTP